jgi:hypothetical protein
MVKKGMKKVLIQFSPKNRIELTMEQVLALGNAIPVICQDFVANNIKFSTSAGWVFEGKVKNDCFVIEASRL